MSKFDVGGSQATVAPTPRRAAVRVEQRPPVRPTTRAAARPIPKAVTNPRAKVAVGDDSAWKQF
jgi:hypothetical protein